MLCIASEYWPLGLSPVDNRTGICWNITTGIHLNIMYAETGKSNGFPIYEILGSKVRLVHICCMFVLKFNHKLSLDARKPVFGVSEQV